MAKQKPAKGGGALIDRLKIVIHGGSMDYVNPHGGSVEICLEFIAEPSATTAL